MANNVMKSGKEEKKPSIFKRAGKFFKDIRSELKKVSWPTKAELRKYTGVVLAFIIVFATVVGVMDWGLVSLLRLITG